MKVVKFSSKLNIYIQVKIKVDKFEKEFKIK